MKHHFFGAGGGAGGAGGFVPGEDGFMLAPSRTTVRGGKKGRFDGGDGGLVAIVVYP